MKASRIDWIERNAIHDDGGKLLDIKIVRLDLSDGRKITDPAQIPENPRIGEFYVDPILTVRS